MDRWGGAAAYERYMGRWSREVASPFVSWLQAPKPARWLDVGSGTGVLAETARHLARPAVLISVDSSSSFVGHVRERLPGAHCTVGEAEALPLLSDSVEVAVAGLMLNFAPHPRTVVAEMSRVARSVVGAYVWDYSGEMQLLQAFWRAAEEMDPAAGELDEGRRFGSVCNPDALAGLFAAANLRDVEVRSIEISTVFSGFDDYWDPFLGGQGPAPSYCMALNESSRRRLRDRLRATLPVEADGTIRLAARAWAAKGRP